MCLKMVKILWHTLALEDPTISKSLSGMVYSMIHSVLARNLLPSFLFPWQAEGEYNVRTGPWQIKNQDCICCVIALVALAYTINSSESVIRFGQIQMDHLSFLGELVFRSFCLILYTIWYDSINQHTIIITPPWTSKWKKERWRWFWHIPVALRCVDCTIPRSMRLVRNMCGVPLGKIKYSPLIAIAS